MTTGVGSGEESTGSTAAGAAAFALAIMFTAATIYLYVLSLTDVIDPPNWVRVLGLVWLPIGFVGVPVAYLFARKGSGRRMGAIGLVIVIVAVAAFVVLQFIAG